MAANQPLSNIPLNSPAWSGRTKRTIALISLAVLGILFWQLTDVLPIVVVALVLSYILNPLTTFLETRILRFLPKPRTWAILLTFLLVAVLLVVLILVILPALFRQVNEFVSAVPAQLESLQAQLEATLSQPLTFNGEPILLNGEPLIPLEQLTGTFGVDPLTTLQPENFDIMGAAGSFLSTLTAPTFSFIGRAFSAMLNVIVLMTMIFYLLMDGKRFVSAIVGVAPWEYQGDARQLMRGLGDVWNAYLRGQLILSSFVGIVVFITATILGLPNAPVLGLISFAFEFVPTLGPLIALVPAAVLALLSESTTFAGLSGVGFAVLVIIVWTVIQNIQAIFVTPRVMGESLDLHPIIVIIGVLVGASLAGALGVILAAPTIASARLFGTYIYRKLMEGREPAPEMVTPEGVILPAEKPASMVKLPFKPNPKNKGRKPDAKA